MCPDFRVSHPKEEGVFQASKWFSYRVLLDESEMEDLFAALPPFELYNVSEIVPIEQATFPKGDFLNEYAKSAGALKRGEVYMLPKALFSSALSATAEAFYAMDVKKGVILKILQPVIQLSIHHFTYAPENQSFHFMVHSQESIQWGLQFSYPQLYSNSIQGDIVEVMKEQTYPNTILFRALMKWMRNHSRPVPFLIDGQKKNVEARMGKKCFDWIENHPQLKEKGLVIA
ncbi:hypothetical protein [Simkania sp.]|uniref:hypothetical protein n=1 Tax=Simkania sp. TaxID=34094 RepID=UPI003B5182B6